MDLKTKSPPKSTQLSRHELWAKIELMIKSKWNGTRRTPCYKNSSSRRYRIPSPSGGHLELGIQIYSRYCRIEIDRWGTTNYDDLISEVWFSNVIWPVIKEGLEQHSRNVSTVLPRGGSQASAWPIPRNKVIETLETWMEAEKILGLPEHEYLATAQ